MKRVEPYDLNAGYLWHKIGELILMLGEQENDAPGSLTSERFKP